MIDIRKYNSDDWDAIAAIHDRSRLDELRYSVGVEAFLSLAATAENEGLFGGEVWVACDRETVVGFVAFAGDEVTWAIRVSLKVPKATIARIVSVDRSILNNFVRSGKLHF